MRDLDGCWVRMVGKDGLGGPGFGCACFYICIAWWREVPDAQITLFQAHQTFVLLGLLWGGLPCLPPSQSQRDCTIRALRKYLSSPSKKHAPTEASI